MEARIAREAIQNSADATLDGEKTEILVWDKPLTASERVCENYCKVAKKWLGASWGSECNLGI